MWRLRDWLKIVALNKIFFWFQMMKNVSKEQADRIFRSCDTSGDNKISLEEFRAMLAKTDKQQSPPKK